MLMKGLHLIFLIFFPFYYSVGQVFTDVGARSVALGKSNVASPSLESIFQNQAGIISIQDFLVSVSYESRYAIKEYSIMAIGAVIPFTHGTFGISYMRFGRNLYRFNKTGIAYARSFGDRISAALQFDILSETYPENGEPFFIITAEMGMIAKINPEVTVGAHLFNPGSFKNTWMIGNYSTPMIFRCGMDWRISNQLNWCVEFEKSNNKSALIKTGFEVVALRDFKLRAGVKGLDLQPSAGFGFVKESLTVDMAFSYHDNLGFSPNATLSYCL